MTGTLGLQKIEALHGRAEDYGKKKEYRENYNFCVSRAVANLSSLSEYCLPFVKVGGYFISYKSGKIEEERKQAEKAVSLLGGKFQDTVYFCLADTDMERAFCIIKKEKNTPGKYPRKAGTRLKNHCKSFVEVECLTRYSNNPGDYSISGGAFHFQPAFKIASL